MNRKRLSTFWAIVAAVLIGVVLPLGIASFAYGAEDEPLEIEAMSLEDYLEELEGRIENCEGIGSHYVRTLDLVQNQIHWIELRVDANTRRSWLLDEEVFDLTPSSWPEPLSSEMTTRVHWPDPVPDVAPPSESEPWWDVSQKSSLPVWGVMCYSACCYCVGLWVGKRSRKKKEPNDEEDTADPRGFAP